MRSYRERLESAREDRRRQFNQRHPANQCSHFVTMRVREPVSVYPVPDLVFKQPAGNQQFLPYGA